MILKFKMTILLNKVTVERKKKSKSLLGHVSTLVRQHVIKRLSIIIVHQSLHDLSVSLGEQIRDYTAEILQPVTGFFLKISG